MMIGPDAAGTGAQTVWVCAARLARTLSRTMDAEGTEWVRWAMLAQRTPGGWFASEAWGQRTERVFAMVPESDELLTLAASFNSAWAQISDGLGCAQACLLRVTRTSPVTVKVECETFGEPPRLPEPRAGDNDSISIRRALTLLGPPVS